MYVALRDLRRARGRFALITAVVLLVTVLVTFLSGLTAGLSHQNISAVQQLPGTSVVFADTGSAASFDESSLTTDQVARWQHAEPDAVAVGISRSRVSSADHPENPVPLVAFGSDDPRRTIAPGGVELSAPAAAQLRSGVGGVVDVGGRELTVTRIVGDDWYAHSPVIYLELADWRSLAPNNGAATVVTFTGDHEQASLAHTTATTVTDRQGALSALPSYRAENSSLRLMTVLLFVISALVIGAFFTVWTVQRVPDIAVLKALGASTASLVRDALGQASVVLAAGTAMGMTIAALTGGLLHGIPFVVSPATTVLPALALVGLGLLGATLALRFLITTDPLTALGGSR